MITIETIHEKMQKLGQAYWIRVKALELEDKELRDLTSKIILLNELIQEANKNSEEIKEENGTVN